MNRHGGIGHERAFELLPWLANGTLEADERERVEQHVRDCLPCRAELKEQRALQAVLRRSPPALHESAEQGFAALQQRVAAPRQRVDAPRQRVDTPRPLAAATGRSRWPRLATAAGIAALGIAVVLAIRVGSMSEPMAPSETTSVGIEEPRYRTLSEPAAGPASRIDIIFEDGVTEMQMRTLLADVGGTIVAGPSALGRYTLRVPVADEAEVDELISVLLEDDRVRFAARSYSPAEGER